MLGKVSGKAKAGYLGHAMGDCVGSCYVGYLVMRLGWG